MNKTNTNRRYTSLALLVFSFILVLTACNSGGNSVAEDTNSSAVNASRTNDSQVKDSDEGTQSPSDYPNAHLLADVSWVAEHLNDPAVVIIDARSKGYEEGHIPGAVSLSSGQLNDSDNEIAGFILPEDKYTEVVQNAGVNQDSTIVVYDDGNALSATRVFYTLEYYGLQDQVKVLNGGYAAWLTEGHDIDIDPAAPEKGNFVAKANENLVSTKAQVEQAIGTADVVFLDTRSAEEYEGTDLRENQRGGHLPGAVHKEWTTAVAENEEGLEKFLSYEQLKQQFEAIGVVEDKTVIPYCQTNVRGSHSYFSLRLLGYSDIRPYEGSWAEWGNSADTDIEI
ncbi:sulfurtransferase [Paenibacillus apis]|uniref:thiosulfate sulfurtransferase n=1 Tax=Paenibacillus apis TaxID=1792174 RepID=A0A919Y8J1_9BACL|nr:sulfurtransferase [Paenibacillus apis]GIO44032.1 sulfurtransferase [Paenibacillus apis]